MLHILKYMVDCCSSAGDLVRPMSKTIDCAKDAYSITNGFIPGPVFIVALVLNELGQTPSQGSTLHTVIQVSLTKLKKKPTPAEYPCFDHIRKPLCLQPLVESSLSVCVVVGSTWMSSS